MALAQITRALRLSSPKTPLSRAGEVAVRSASTGSPTIIDARGSHAAAVAAAERILRYTFCDKSLLAEALTHSSHPARPSYDNLRHVGDGALCASLSQHHLRHHPDLAPRLLASEMCPHRLALIALDHGLYRFLRRNAPKLDQMVVNYKFLVDNILALDAEQMIGACLERGIVLVAPPVLGDVVKSVAGAVHVDCGYDQAMFWKKFGRFWQPLEP